MNLIILLLLVACSKSESVYPLEPKYSIALTKGTIFTCPQTAKAKLQLIKDVRVNDVFSAQDVKSLDPDYTPTAGTEVPCGLHRYKLVNNVLVSCFNTQAGWQPTQCQ